MRLSEICTAKPVSTDFEFQTLIHFATKSIHVRKHKILSSTNKDKGNMMENRGL
jgi:hypothetical protein